MWIALKSGFGPTMHCLGSLIVARLVCYFERKYSVFIFRETIPRRLMAIHLRHFTALCKYFSAMTLLLNGIYLVSLSQITYLCLRMKLKQAPHLSGIFGQSRDAKRIAFSLLYNIIWCCGESTCFPPPRGLDASSSNGAII